MAPAEYAARVFGGVCKLARTLGRHPGRVSHWLRPTSEGGSGGRIPSDSVKLRLLELAAERSLDLTADDLIRGRDVPDPPAPRLPAPAPFAPRERVHR